ncbi:MAG: F0F1 ATP synthase subunit B [Bacteroidales bacterium]
MAFVILGLVTPGLGLIFWKTIAFLIVMFILAKYAWPPILKALKQRENSINEALDAAEKAREHIKNMEAENQKLIATGKKERDAILADARKMREQVISEGKETAKKESEKIIEEAKNQIHYERMEAMTELKNEVANLSIDIAEKILQDELADKNRHQELIQKQLKKVKFN